MYITKNKIMETIYEQLGINECTIFQSYIIPIQHIKVGHFDHVLFTADFDSINCFTQSEIDEFCKEYDITLIETQAITQSGYTTQISYCMQDTNLFIDNWLENIEEN